MSNSLLKAAFLIVVTSVCLGQTVPDFIGRYGNAEVERFLISTDITLTAAHGADRSACEMKIEPKHSILTESDRHVGMAPETAERIVDDLIPTSERGILLNHIIANMGAAEERIFQYQNVTITHALSYHLRKHHNEDSATIVRHDGLCGTPTEQRTNGNVAIPLKAIDLQSRYGEADVQQFAVRPTVNVAIESGPDHNVCGMLVGRELSLLRSNEPPKYMLPELVTEILDELIPESVRGAEMSHSITKSGCNEIDITDYGHVTVVRFRHNCRLPDPEVEGRATFTRKDAGCKSLKR